MNPVQHVENGAAPMNHGIVVNKTVPLRITIQPREGILGYLTRVAEQNCYDRATWLLPESFQTILQTRRWTEEAASHLAEITGIAVEEIRSRIYWQVGEGQQTFFGHQVDSLLIGQPAQRPVQKFCSDCLKEDGYYSALFDLTVIHVCPKHGRRLSTKCHHCGKTTYWGRPNLISCTYCGGDLTAPTEEIVPGENLIGVTAVAAMAGFPHRHPVLADAQFEIPTEIQHLTLGQIIILMIALPKYLGQRSTRAEFLHFNAEERAQLHNILTTGWNFISTWPFGFYEFLELYSSARTGAKSDVYGIKNAFGQFYAYLSLQNEEPWVTARAAFQFYLENHWRGHLTPKSSPTPTMPQQIRLPRVSSNEASRLLGRSIGKTRDLIRRGILKATPIGTWKGAPVLISRTDIEALTPDGRAPLQLKQVGKLLGISRQRATQLHESGVITPIHGPSIDGSKIYMFRSSDALAILDDIGRQKRNDLSDASKSMPFACAMKAQRIRNIPLNLVIGAMRSGIMPPVGIDAQEQGLNAFLFERTNVIETLRELENKQVDRQALSTYSAAAKIGVTSTAIKRLADTGFLCAAGYRGPRLQVTTDSVTKFHKRYVTLGKLARRLDMSCSTTLLVTKAAGVPPIARTKAPKDIPFFFERKRIDALNFEQLIPKALVDAEKKRHAKGIEHKRAKRKELRMEKQQFAWDSRLTLCNPTAFNDAWIATWSHPGNNPDDNNTINVYDALSARLLATRHARLPTSTILMNALDDAARIHGFPRRIVLDRSRSSTAKQISDWAATHGIELLYQSAAFSMNPFSRRQANVR